MQELVTSAERAATERAAVMKEAQAAYAAQGMTGTGAASNLIGQQLAGSEFTNDLKMQMESSAQYEQMLAQKVAMDKEATTQINAAHEQALRMDIERNNKRIAAEEAALTKMTSINASELKKMKSHWAEMNGEEVVEGSKKAAGGINLLSLASIAAIAKVQVMYSLINSAMSLIGSFPSTAIDAIEQFNASAIKNAAVITSMVGDVNNIGEAYKQNKVYADAVQETLVKMASSTIVSSKQLQIMNDAFVQQGVFIDINNQKQLDGYKNIANALATITANMPNADMQFSQEIRALMSGEMRPGDQLAKQLTAIDPLLKQHLAEWKQIAFETNNAGYVLEKIGPLLVGYAAASGDISSLWTTVKTTLSTIYNEILRGGLSEGFKEIVEQMKELAKYAEENKEKIQAFLKEGFADAKDAAVVIWKIADAMSVLAKPAMYAAAIMGMAGIIAKVTEFYKVVAAGEAISAGGMLGRAIRSPALMIAAVGAVATYKTYEWSKSNETDKRRVEAIRAYTPDNASNSAEQIRSQQESVKFLDVKTLRSIINELPMATDKDIAMYFREGAISGVGAGLKIDKAQIEKLKSEAGGIVKTPNAPKPDNSKELEKERKLEEEIDKKYLAYQQSF